MLQSIAMVLISSIMNTMILFDFSESSDLAGWQIVNDNVMGGISQSSFIKNKNENAVFKGSVSLDNNGGFCSVRTSFDPIMVKDFEKIIIRLKGDGKIYQIRIKSKRTDYHSYIAYFQTTGEWQETEIILNDMFPGFRGRKLEMPDFSDETIEEIAFLIGNKKEENFELEISRIALK